MSFNYQFACGTEDILVAGQRDAEGRARRRITRQQATILENAFNENPKPNRKVRQELAQVLAISPRNVQVRCSPQQLLIKDMVSEQKAESKDVEEDCGTTNARSIGSGDEAN